MADARSARQKVLQDREPMRPLMLTEADLIRRASKETLPNLGAAIAKSTSAQSDLPYLAPQEAIEASASENPPNLHAWGGIALLSLLVMGAAVGARAFL